MKKVKESMHLRLREFRKAARMTQDEISEKAGIPLRTYQDIEYGKTENPGVNLIAPIAKALNVSIDYLYYGESKEGKHPQLHVLVDRLDNKGVETFSGLIEGYILRNQSKNSGVG